MIDWLRHSGDPVVELPSGELLPLALRRHPTARRMVLRLAADGSEARLTMPRWGRTAEALAFAQARSEWLGQQRARIPRRLTIDHGIELPWRGRPLIIDWQAGAPRAPQVADGRLVLGGERAAIARRVQRWLEHEARLLLAADLAEYAPRAGCAVPPLGLSRATRRWGSCSARGMVRINWRLAMAPDFVRRSVAAHEVAHLVHFDHSAAFHALLADLYEGDLTAANRWLRDHGRTLYAPFG